MSDFPPVLLAERIEAMLSGLAELCFAGAEEAGARLKAAEDAEDFERITRAMQTHARNLHQTLAMKQRFDRHQARMATEARQEARETRQDTPIGQAVVSRRFREVRNRMRDLIWTEYDESSRVEALEDLDENIARRSRKDLRAFLDAPLEDLVADLSAMMHVGEFAPDPGDEDQEYDDPDDDDYDDDDGEADEPEPPDPTVTPFVPP